MTEQVTKLVYGDFLEQATQVINKQDRAAKKTAEAFENDAIEWATIPNATTITINSPKSTVYMPPFVPSSIPPLKPTYISTTPWADRGITVPSAWNSYMQLIEGTDSYNNGIKDKVAHSMGIPPLDERPDMCLSFSNYYLLEAIASGCFLNPNVAYSSSWELGHIKAEAKTRLDKLVAEHAPIYLAYLRMAVWGEARYQRAIEKEYQNHGASSRTYGWYLTPHMEEAIGNDCYADLRDVFDSMGSGGGVGGKKWANIADTVHRRWSGKINDRIFMDRAFHLQHNNGIAFNKLKWPITNRAGWNIQGIQFVLGPAQAAKATNLAPLYLIADGDVQRLWKAHIVAGNREAVRMAQVPVWDRISGVTGLYLNKTDNLELHIKVYNNNSKAIKSAANKAIRARLTPQNRDIRKRATLRNREHVRHLKRYATEQAREERRRANIEKRLILKAQKDTIRLLAKAAKVIGKKVPAE